MKKSNLKKLLDKGVDDKAFAKGKTFKSNEAEVFQIENTKIL